jgi:16S rRNA C967 or C1407 C5-methylase (RsmB/RsmF family)
MYRVNSFLHAWIFRIHEKSPYAENGYYTDVPAGIGYTPAYLGRPVLYAGAKCLAAVTILDPKPGMYVADLCAAPGFKEHADPGKASESGTACIK